jgi:hypothetical protein
MSEVSKVIELLLSSSLVSAITLGILLFRRRRPRDLAIPTFGYGAPESNTASKLKLSRPPVLLWLLVILITLCFALAYYRDDSESLAGQNTPNTFVWVDRSLSAWLAFHDPEKGVDSERLAREIMRYASRVTFIKSTTTWSQSEAHWQVNYSTEEAGSVSTAKAIIESMYTRGASSEVPSGPLPFASDLDTEGFREALYRSSASHGASATSERGHLIVLTDAQRSSMAGLTSVSQFFSALHLVALPPTAPLAISGRELIPRSLARAWSSEGSDPLPNVAPEAAILTLPPARADHPSNSQPTEPSWAQPIPEDARPGIFLAEFPGGEALITSADSGLVMDRSSDGQTATALFTHCSKYPGGPAELNPLADLQAFARFFNVKLRTIDCTEQMELDTQKRSADPWQFRRASLWLVPLSKAVSNILLFQNTIWLPNGFIPEQDSVFFFADPSEDSETAGDPSVTDTSISRTMRRQVVQLEENSVPLPLYLAPPPPQKALRLAVSNSESRHDSPQGTFIPVYTTPDKIPLIFQFNQRGATKTSQAQALDQTTPDSDEGRQRVNEVYYLRTTMAMPNGELGRSSLWPNFWLQALARAGTRRSGISVVRYSSPSGLSQTPFPPRPELNTFTRLTNGDHWQRSQGSPAEANGTGLAAGLYEHTQSGHLYLLDFPLTERDGQFLTEAELQESFVTEGQVANQIQEEAPGQVLWHTVLAVLAGLIGLIAYWLRVNDSTTKDGTRIGRTTVSTAICFLLVAWPLADQSRAVAQAEDNEMTRRLFQGLTGNVSPFLGGLGQKLPDDILVPFRISWCTDGDQATVRAGYAQFRNMLAARGTIHLNKDVLFGKCFPGGAEIWWTDDVDDLDPTFLKTHIRSGGVFVLEGTRTELQSVPEDLLLLEEPSVGLRWETPEKRGMLYRSFYLLQTFDGCAQDETKMLTLRKKETAKSPMGLITSASFLRKKKDCFADDQDYRNRSFVNLMYSLLTTDYKEDQLQLPELLKRVRSLGLEP